VGALDARTLPGGQPLSSIVVPVRGGRAGVVRLLDDERRAILVPPRSTDLLGFTVSAGREALTARLHDLAGGQQLAAYAGHQEPISDVAPSPDGSHVATAAENVRIFKTQPSEARSVLTGPATGGFRSVSWSPDGARLAAQAGGSDRTCVWRVAQGALEATLVHTGIRRGASYFAGDGEIVVVGTSTVALARWPADTSRSQPIPPGGIFWERRDEKAGAFTGPTDWNAIGGAPPGLEFISSALSGDRSTLALGLSDGRVWRVRLPGGWDARRELSVAPDVPEALALSHDGRWLAAGGARTVVYHSEP
jgi:WD40 repeat protein